MFIVLGTAMRLWLHYMDQGDNLLLTLEASCCHIRPSQRIFITAGFILASNTESDTSN